MNQSLRPGSYGAHGYEPTNAEMGAFFAAKGPSFQNTNSIHTHTHTRTHSKQPLDDTTLATPLPPLGRIDNIHVYNLLCWCLWVSPAPNNGTLDAFLPYLQVWFVSSFGLSLLIFFFLWLLYVHATTWKHHQSREWNTKTNNYFTLLDDDTNFKDQMDRSAFSQMGRSAWVTPLKTYNWISSSANSPTKKTTKKNMAVVWKALD